VLECLNQLADPLRCHSVPLSGPAEVQLLGQDQEDLELPGFDKRHLPIVQEIVIDGADGAWKVLSDT
jgi:hypothetical protein